MIGTHSFDIVLDAAFRNLPSSEFEGLDLSGLKQAVCGGRGYKQALYLCYMLNTMAKHSYDFR